MHYTDSHIHLQDFKSVNATEIILQASALWINKFICVSSTKEDWENVEKLFLRFRQNIYPAIGIHPWNAENVVHGWEQAMENKLKHNPDLLIGECGLDAAKKRNVEAQLAVFALQIALAQKYNRPMLIHSVHATDKTLSMLKDVKVPFVWHSYGGSAETAKQIIKYGGYLGVNEGFFKSKYHEQVLSSVNMKYLLPESDAPYQYSIATIPLVTQKLACFYNVDSELFYQNFLRFVNGK